MNAPPVVVPIASQPNDCINQYNHISIYLFAFCTLRSSVLKAYTIKLFRTVLRQTVLLSARPNDRQTVCPNDTLFNAAALPPQVGDFTRMLSGYLFEGFEYEFDVHNSELNRFSPNACAS